MAHARVPSVHRSLQCDSGSDLDQLCRFVALSKDFTKRLRFQHDCSGVARRTNTMSVHWWKQSVLRQLRERCEQADPKTTKGVQELAGHLQGAAPCASSPAEWRVRHDARRAQRSLPCSRPGVSPYRTSQ